MLPFSAMRRARGNSVQAAGSCFSHLILLE
jgi:hypothetical protein